jgi:hypothetical protein
MTPRSSHESKSNDRLVVLIVRRATVSVLSPAAAAAGELGVT